MPKNKKDELIEQYRKRIESELGEEKDSSKIISTDYSQFRKDSLSRKFSFYEKACNFSEKVMPISPDKKQSEKLKKSIHACHLRLTPTGVLSFSILGPLIFTLFGVLLSALIVQDMFFVFFFLILGLVAMTGLQKLPFFIETGWRMKAGNQLVLSIFYIVTYMRHTSNLENAIEFASNHLEPPISLDFKRILWDVETQKFESVKESIGNYLLTWKDWNRDFIDSMNLIESSLYEGGEDKRLLALDKSLSVILDGTYEKMLHYAHNLKSPITMLHMLGVILPILGLVILPLVVSFMENVSWYHIALLYNVSLPLGVYYLGKKILSTRPTGYGGGNMEVQKKKKKVSLFKNPLFISVSVGVILFLIGISPLLLHMAIPIEGYDICIGNRGLLIGTNIDISQKSFCLLDYKITETGVKGPYGLGASLLSIFIPLALGLSIALYFKKKSKKIMKVRKRTKLLENEFASALFQLGGRLGDGLPAEMAFRKVAVAMEGTESAKFFKIVDNNIRRLGMGIKDAIFDAKHGAIIQFPSNIINSSMKVLIESVKKGPVVAAQALTNIATYIKEIHRVDERLKDLMGDIVGSMKSQIKFLTPVISGIVVGITSMITGILGRLTDQMGALSQQSGAQMGGVGVADMFGAGIPTYFFQIVVGIYVVQLVIILIILSNNIENGIDKAKERYRLGKEVASATILYCFISLAVMAIFNIIANVIMSSTL